MIIASIGSFRSLIVRASIALALAAGVALSTSVASAQSFFTGLGFLNEPVGTESYARAANADGAIDAFDVEAFIARLLSASAQDADVDAELNAIVDPIWRNNVAPGEWCGTYQRYVAGLIDRGMNPLDVVCAEVGPCDNPVDRNASIPTLATPIKTYRLSIHVFREDDGSNPAATQGDVDTAVARLNADYGPWRIQFFYQTNFINSTTYRTLSSGEEFGMKRTYADSPATKLNVYVVNTGGNNWGTFPWDPDALGKQGGIVMNGFTSPIVFTHEVGHCVGLWHTHHGVTEVPACGDCYEHADRTPDEGDITGDRCGETNPITNTGSCVNPGVDPCTGSPLLLPPPFNNYMSYSLSCAYEFTPQQAGRMHCWTTDILSGWLQLPMPPAAPGTPTLTNIGSGQIRVAWADNSNNEDGFRVQRAKKLSGSNWSVPLIIADVGANITSVTDVPGPGTFRYRVQAYNGLGDSAWSAWKQINN